MTDMIVLCVAALRAFVWPDLSHWNGVPANCTLAELGQVFTVPGDGWRAAGYVGEEQRELAWTSVSGGGFPDSVRVWLDGERIAAMDSRLLVRAPDWEVLAAKLGPPAAKLDAYFSQVLLEKSEWVYPERGLTLFVNPGNQVLLRVAAYPRTTLPEYRKRFRLILGPTVRYARTQDGNPEMHEPLKWRHGSPWGTP
jgi:hypothetical protein